MIRARLFWVGLVCGSASLHAQTSTGGVVGTVQDPGGAVVPHVVVTLTTEATSQQRRTSSNELGEYSFPFTPPGQYTITAELAGFKRVELKGIVLEVGQVARFNLTLPVGDVREKILVTGDTLLLQTESTAVGQVITQRQTLELPLNGRNFLDLTALVPGAVYGAPGTQSNRLGGVRGATAINVHGARSAGNTFLLDGIMNQDPDFNTYIVNPPVDVIQEFKVQTSNYSAEFGGVAGGQFNVITKSGGNDFHGTVYEFLRNSYFDARNFFDRVNPQFIRNQFGGTLGGPVVVPHLYHGKNKTFFFFGYEGLRLVQAQTSTSSVPTAAMKAGDFSSLNLNTYDPSTLDGATGRRLPFAGKRIPAPRLSPQATGLLKFWPASNLPGTVTPTGEIVSNFLSNESRRQTNDQVNLRVDQQVGSRGSVFGRYSVTDEAAFAPGSFPQTGGVLDIRAQNLGIGSTVSISPAVVNEFRFGFARFRNASRPELQENIAGAVGIEGVSQAKTDWGIPSMGIRGLSGIGAPTPTVDRNNIFQ